MFSFLKIIWIFNVTLLENFLTTEQTKNDFVKLFVIFHRQAMFEFDNKTSAKEEEVYHFVGKQTY